MRHCCPKAYLNGNLHFASCPNACGAARYEGAARCTPDEGHPGEHRVALPSVGPPRDQLEGRVQRVDLTVVTWGPSITQPIPGPTAAEKQPRAQVHVHYSLPKPPLGVKPRWLVEEIRFRDLSNALDRYAFPAENAQEGEAPAWRWDPKAVARWLEEMLDLVEQAEKRRAAGDPPRGHG